MNIKVAMLSGINRVDTPMFDTLVEQQQFFSGAPNLIEIETTYYPPHYTNKIRISVEDIDFTESVNYLWFDFRGNNASFRQHIAQTRLLPRGHQVPVGRRGRRAATPPRPRLGSEAGAS